MARPTSLATEIMDAQLLPCTQMTADKRGEEGNDGVAEGIRRTVVRVFETYERSITQTKELFCPACYDLRGAWKEGLDVFQASADSLIASVQRGDRGDAEEEFDPFSEAMCEVTVAETAFVRHLDNHLTGKTLDSG